MPRRSSPVSTQDRARAQSRAEAHQSRYTLAEAHGGSDLRHAIKVHWKRATYTTWAEAVGELAAGPTVTVQCKTTPRAQQGGWSQHKVRLTPDGGLDLLHHPGIDVEAERLLAALGAPLCACVALALYLPIRQDPPRTAVPAMVSVSARLRTLHTAVAWAQRPDTVWTPEFGNAYLEYGITPTLIEEWTAAGWEPQAAVRFLQQYAAREVADRWRAAGDTSARAAAAAGRGEVPAGDAEWLAVGFTATTAERWRRNGGFTAAEAWEWERHGVAPTVAFRLEEADRLHGLPVATSKAWCAAGIASPTMLGWYRATGGDLPTALYWQQAKIPPDHLSYYRDWNTAHPDQPLTPALVAPYVRAKIPASAPALIAEAVRLGVSAEDYRAALTALTEADGGPLLAALAGYTPDPSEESGWYRVTDPTSPGVHMLRSGWARPMTRFVLHWLAAH